MSDEEHDVFNPDKAKLKRMAERHFAAEREAERRMVRREHELRALRRITSSVGTVTAAISMLALTNTVIDLGGIANAWRETTQGILAPVARFAGWALDGFVSGLSWFGAQIDVSALITNVLASIIFGLITIFSGWVLIKLRRKDKEENDD